MPDFSSAKTPAGFLPLLAFILNAVGFFMLVVVWADNDMDDLPVWVGIYSFTIGVLAFVQKFFGILSDKVQLTQLLAATVVPLLTQMCERYDDSDDSDNETLLTGYLFQLVAQYIYIIVPFFFGDAGVSPSGNGV